MDANHPLDASAVHPESYSVVERIAADLNCTVNDIINNAPLRKKIPWKQYVTEQTGELTLSDIQSELDKPGRDPRPAFTIFNFKEGIETLLEFPCVVLPATS